MAVPTVECTPPIIASGHNVRYEIHDRFTVPEADATTLRLDIWCPVVPETPYLLFFAGPYAERNGEPLVGLDRHISFVVTQ